MHWEILDPRRKKLVTALSYVKEFGFYLAGGTALALHLGHRQSVDFDFYTGTDFDAVRFEAETVHHLKGFKVTQRSKGTLLGRAGPVEITFFYYPYPLIDSLTEENGLQVVSVADIAAMKLIALSQRGRRRDFLDLFVIAKKVGFKQVFLWAGKKFPQVDPYVSLKSLTYFKDADEDDSGRGMTLKEDVPWTRIKAYFEKEAAALSRKWL